MRWDSVDPHVHLTSPDRLFVRDHVATPTISAATYQLRIFGDGLAHPRTADRAVTLSYADLRAMPVTRMTTIHECTGNGRSSFASQQGKAATGTQWTLGVVGAVAWEGVRLRTVLDRIGLDPAWSASGECRAPHGLTVRPPRVQPRFASSLRSLRPRCARPERPCSTPPE
jgi:hypothetical protein